MRSGRTPWWISVRAVARIITSGPQTKATVSDGVKWASRSSVVTTPTRPVQPPEGRSTVTAANGLPQAGNSSS